MTPHLSEDDLNDALLDLTTLEADRHLASCAHCSDQLAAFRATVGAFNKASLAWSEARSNSMPLELPRKRFSFAGFGSLGSLAVSATLAFVVALLLTVGLHQRSTLPDPSVASSTQPRQPSNETTRQDEIASDNAMLAAINSELYHPTPSPLEAYEPDSNRTRSTHNRRAVSTQVKD